MVLPLALAINIDQRLTTTDEAKDIFMDYTSFTWQDTSKPKLQHSALAVLFNICTETYGNSRLGLSVRDPSS
jgi:hypothetical protein